MLWIKNLSIFAIPAIYYYLITSHIAIQFFHNEYSILIHSHLTHTAVPSGNLCLIIITPLCFLTICLFIFVTQWSSNAFWTHAIINFSYIRFLSYSILNSEILLSDLKPNCFDHNHLHFSLDSHSQFPWIKHVPEWVSITVMELFLYW